MERTEKLIKQYDRAMFVSFCALIYFLPISIALIEWTSGIALLFFFLKRFFMFKFAIERKQIVIENTSLFNKVKAFILAFMPIDNILNKPILFFLMVCFLSMFQSEFFVVSLKGFLGKFMQSIFVYFTFIECVNTKKRIRNFLIVVLFSATIVISNGLAQRFMGKGFIFGHKYDGRISSSLRQANDLGAYLVAIIPIIFSVVFISFMSARDVIWKIFNKYFTIIILLLSLVCLGFTYSRGAIVGFVCSLIFFVFVMKEKKKYLIYMLILFSLYFIPKLYVERIDLGGWQGILHNNNRTVYWEGPLFLIKNHPFFGVGINAYSLEIRKYVFKFGGYPHNCYLQMGSEIGIIGLFTFFYLIFTLFKNSFVRLNKITDKQLRIIFVGALAGFFGYLIHSFFDTNFYSVQLGVLMWIVMGLIVSVQRCASN